MRALLTMQADAARAELSTSAAAVTQTEAPRVRDAAEQACDEARDSSEAALRAEAASLSEGRARDAAALAEARAAGEALSADLRAAGARLEAAAGEKRAMSVRYARALENVNAQVAMLTDAVRVKDAAAATDSAAAAGHVTRGPPPASRAREASHVPASRVGPGPSGGPSGGRRREAGAATGSSAADWSGEFGGRERAGAAATRAPASAAPHVVARDAWPTRDTGTGEEEEEEEEGEYGEGEWYDDDDEYNDERWPTPAPAHVMGFDAPAPGVGEKEGDPRRRRAVGQWREAADERYAPAAVPQSTHRGTPAPPYAQRRRQGGAGGRYEAPRAYAARAITAPRRAPARGGVGDGWAGAWG